MKINHFIKEFLLKRLLPSELFVMIFTPVRKCHKSIKDPSLPLDSDQRVSRLALKWRRTLLTDYHFNLALENLLMINKAYHMMRKVKGIIGDEATDDEYLKVWRFRFWAEGVKGVKGVEVIYNHHTHDQEPQTMISIFYRLQSILLFNHILYIDLFELNLF